MGEIVNEMIYLILSFIDECWIFVSDSELSLLLEYFVFGNT